MKARFKELRKALGMTQQAFADAMGISRNFVTQIEMGIKVPSDRTLADICREFSVNESWLRNGDGDMFTARRKDDMIAKMLADVLVDEESFKYRLISALSKLDADGWSKIEEFIDSIASQEE